MTTRSTLSSDSPDLLAALADLDGVDGVSPESMDEVRVQLGADRDPGAVGASIASLLREKFGVVETGISTVEEIGAIEGDGRLALDRLLLVAGDRGTRAEVVVRLDDRTASGSATGDAADSGAGSGAESEADAGAAAITTALLLAVEELTEDAVIGGIERIGIDSDGVARVRLRLDIDGSDVSASGEAAVVRHRPQAVVRAVLAALAPHLP